jgi:16S rRNA (uracil1498-N3)-methyltransferase
VRFVFGDNETQLVTLPEKESHYVRNVLRLQSGDSIELGDSESGALGEGTIADLADRVTVKLSRVTPASKHASPTVILLCALCKGDKNDQICDWATELGCQTIVFWQSSRSIVRLRNPQECARKAERLRAISLAAAQQSRQQRPPQVSVHSELTEALKALPHLDIATKAICSLVPNALPITSLRSASDQESQPLIIAVGPEGDFSPEEYTTLTTEYGFIPVSLGSSVLRSELAVVSALTAVRVYR